MTNTTQTETATKTLADIATFARKTAAENAFDYAGNFGRGTFRYEIKVTLNDSGLTLSATTNAQISEEKAKEELSKVWEAVVSFVGSDANQFKTKFFNGKKIGRGGFYHMSRFCTESFYRGIEVR